MAPVRVIAVYDFEPRDDDELQFYQDEYISVLEQGEDGWWKGYVEQHPETVGLFPANYVKETESPLVVQTHVSTVQEEQESVSNESDIEPKLKEEELYQEPVPIQEKRQSTPTISEMKKQLEEAKKQRFLAEEARRMAEMELNSRSRRKSETVVTPRQVASATAPKSKTPEPSRADVLEIKAPEPELYENSVEIAPPPEPIPSPEPIQVPVDLEPPPTEPEEPIQVPIELKPSAVEPEDVVEIASEPIPSPEPVELKPNGINVVAVAELEEYIATAVRERLAPEFARQDQEIRQMNECLSMLIEQIGQQNRLLQELHHTGIDPIQSDEDEDNRKLNRQASRDRLIFPSIGKAKTNVKKDPPHRNKLPQINKKTKDLGKFHSPDCKSALYYPPQFDPTQARRDAPSSTMELEYVHGYNGAIPLREGVPRSRNVLYRTKTNEIVFPAAAIVAFQALDSGTQRFYLQHDASVHSLAMHPDQKVFASAQEPSKLGGYGYVHVWNGESTNDLLQTIDASAFIAKLKTGSNTTIICLEFSHDGAILVGVGNDEQHTVNVWNWKTQQLLTSARSHKLTVFDMAFSPIVDERDSIVYGLGSCGDKHVKFWTLTECRSSRDTEWKLASIDGLKPNQNFMCLAFISFESNEGLWLTGTEYGDIYVWKHEYGPGTYHQCPSTVQVVSVISAAHRTSLVSLAVNSSNAVASSDAEGFIHYWNAKELYGDTDSDVNRLTTPRIARLDQRTRCITWTRDDKIIAGLTTNQIVLMGSQEVTPQTLVTTHSSRIEAFCTHPIKNWFITIGTDRTLCLWDAITSVKIGQTVLDYGAASVCFHPQGEMIAVALHSGEFRILEVENWTLVHQQKLERIDETSKKFTIGLNKVSGTIVAQVIKYSPDGRYLAVACQEKLLIFDVADNYTQLCLCRGHCTVITQFDWSIDSNAIQSSDLGAELLLWAVPTGESITEGDRIRKILWSEYTCVYGWPVQGISNAKSRIKCLARSHGSKVIVAGDDETKQLRLYRYPSLPKAQCRSFAGHASSIRHVSFLQDDSVVLSTEEKYPVILQWHHVQRQHNT